MLTFQLIVLLCIQLTVAQFTENFQQFLAEEYGDEYAKYMLRSDIGDSRGSFGGSSSFDQVELNYDPIVMIHGLGTDNGLLFPVRDFFVQRGYARSSIFSVAYGPANHLISLQDEMLCEYILPVRRLIKAVNKYTKRNVIVMGFSLGGAVTRKAILGGKCIDNNNDLGPPLTSIVSKYFSMSGVNWGIDFCVDRYRTQPICNNVSGVYPYSSEFIKDINKEQHYEGRITYIIASKNDEVVGYNEMYLPKADVNVTFNCVGSPTNMNGFFPFHVAAMLQTLNSQFELIKTGRVSQQTLDADVQSENLNFGQQCTGTVQYGSQDENNSRSYNVFSCSFFVVAAFLILRFVLY